jgi:hypothetical protein
MKSGCISHPTKEPLILIRQWQLEFTGGNEAAAALLSFFEYWHDIKLDISAKATRLNEIAQRHGEKAEQDASLWQFHTNEELERGVMIFKETALRAGIKKLLELGVIEVGRNPNKRYAFDNTKYFLFHPDVVQRFLESRPVKNEESSLENTGRDRENTGQSLENTGTITETSAKTSTKTKNTNVVLPDLQPLYDSYNQNCGGLPKSKNNKRVNKTLLTLLKETPTHELAEKIKGAAKAVCENKYWLENAYGFQNLLNNLDSKYEVYANLGRRGASDEKHKRIPQANETWRTQDNERFFVTRCDGETVYGNWTGYLDDIPHKDEPRPLHHLVAYVSG